MTYRSIGLFTASVVAGLLAPGVARACSPSRCLPAQVAPAVDARVPANFSGFPVINQTERNRADGGADPDPNVVLTDPAGQPVALERQPLARGWGLLVPKAELAPGAYKLSFSNTCNLAPYGPAASDKPQRTIEVVAASPRPTSAGSVRVMHERVERYTVPANAACSEIAPVALARVVLTPSAELAPFLPLARYKVSIDGHLWAEDEFGGVPRDAYNGYNYPPKLPLEIFTTCRDGAFAGPGRHTGQLEVELPGWGPLPAVPFEFTLDCGDTGSACAVGTPTRTSWAWLTLPALALAAVVYRRRKR